MFRTAANSSVLFRSIENTARERRRAIERAPASLIVVCGFLFAACGDSPDASTLPVDTAGTTGASGSWSPAGGAAVTGAAGMAVPTAVAGSPSRPAPPVAPVAGSSAASAGVGAGIAGRGALAGAPAAVGGTAGSAPDVTNHDACTGGELVDPRDAQLTDIPDQWKSPSNGAIDLVVPKAVLAWMSERVWEPSHDAWHNVRRCRGGGFGIPGAAGGMSLCSKPELVPQHQECADAEDGYQFLVVHRHMIQALKQAFPQHKSQFEGFAHFPFEAKDVPMEWQARWGTGWAANIKTTAQTLEDIENKLSMFPTEGDLGKFIQCGGMANGASSIHGALHFKWVVNDSPYSLGKQTVNIDNHMFWKLHGWIDNIWERYRVAKGIAPDEPKLKQALVGQCMEMHNLGHAIKPGATKPPATPLPVEKGEFVENVRPILEKTCSSCHSESSPESALSLGGQISSADVVKGLVNVTAMHGGQFKRVVPGDPSKSWLYLKVSDMARAAGCTGAMCNAQVMPPTGQVTLSTAELGAIQKWIMNGAPAPTQ